MSIELWCFCIFIICIICIICIIALDVSERIRLNKEAKELAQKAIIGWIIDAKLKECPQHKVIKRKLRYVK